MWATYGKENSEVIEALLKAGADIEARDAYDRTPLIHAAENNSNPEVIETLAEGRRGH